ncbi:MAG: tetratricopeptide repeat protein [Elusimicrobiota bacterium]
MKRLGLAMLLAWPAVFARPAAAKPDEEKAPTLEGLFLDFSKTQLGTLSSHEAKKKYLYTIQLEKSRMMHRLLRTVYENAYDLYKEGDFDGSRELTAKILSMDPGFQDAAILHRASVELDGAPKPGLSERRLVEDRFEEGMTLYRQGRLVEATQRWEEATKLSPGNLKARYWLRKARGELADEHFRRGQRAYQLHRLRESLDQWYSALVLNPKYPRLMGTIARVESELRRQEANDKLQQALALYGQGQSASALKLLDEVLRIEPGEAKAQKLINEIRLEIASQHVAEGRNQYKERQYKQAVDSWNKAVDYGYDPRRANVLIARAKEQMQRESEARRRKAEQAKRDAEEEEQRKKDEEERKKQEEADKAKAEAAAASAPGDVQVQGAGTAADENKKNAVRHWQQGLVAYQRNDYAKARDEWRLCVQFDPTNSDCSAGLQRIDQTYGGAQ